MYLLLRTSLCFESLDYAMDWNVAISFYSMNLSFPGISRGGLATALDEDLPFFKNIPL